jgi:hypothetical protein
MEHLLQQMVLGQEEQPSHFVVQQAWHQVLVSFPKETMRGREKSYAMTLS